MAQVTTRRLTTICAALAGLVGAAVLGAFAAAAQDYPSKPIRLIVPFAAGGAVDAVARLIAPPLAARLGQSIVIDNRGGAGGVIGMDAVAKAPPDGYTLLLAHSGITYLPGLHRTLPFEPTKDFAGVITAVNGSYVLAVNAGTPFRSVAELIAYAKAHPGELSYGSAGSGSTLHLAGEFFKRAAGVDILHVPYKGASQATADLLGGQVQMMFGPTVAILPLAQAGKVRALAVASAQRSALAPDLPTVAESGLPGFEVGGWYGLAAPAGTPKPVLTRLNTEANQVLQSRELIEAMKVQGYEPLGGAPEELNERIKQDVARWTQIIRDAGIQAQ